MFELRIHPDGAEPFDVTAGMRDVRQWEKTHRGRGLGQLQSKDGISATILFEIAYTACRRQSRIPAGLTEDEFADTFEIDVETPDEKAARLRAENLKRHIEDGEVPEDGDPTPPAV
jgi:hypothetical protein